MVSNPSQAVVHLDLRRIRLGYLVRQGSREDLRRAILEASSRWGGIQVLLLAPDGLIRIPQGSLLWRRVVRGCSWRASYSYRLDSAGSRPWNSPPVHGQAVAR